MLIEELLRFRRRPGIFEGKLDVFKLVCILSNVLSNATAKNAVAFDKLLVGSEC